MLGITKLIGEALTIARLYLEERQRHSRYNLLLRSIKDERAIHEQLCHIPFGHIQEDIARASTGALRRRLKLQQHVTAALARELGVPLSTEASNAD